MDESGLSNRIRYEHLPKGLRVLATEGTPKSSNKTERLSYKGECTNA